MAWPMAVEGGTCDEEYMGNRACLRIVYIFTLRILDPPMEGFEPV